MINEFRGVNLYRSISQEYLKKIDPIRDKIPVDIEEIARNLGINLIPMVLKAGVSGAIQKKQDESIHIYHDISEPRARQRFTIAHEIGHYLLGHLDKETYLSENILLRSNLLTNSQERDANYLAAELLMPMSKIDEIIDAKRVPPYSFSLDELAGILDVSEKALRVRLGIA